jgi:hypothetical protein
MQVKKDFAIEKLKKKYLMKKPIHVGQLVNIKDEDAVGTRRIKNKISLAWDDYEKANDMFK